MPSTRRLAKGFAGWALPACLLLSAAEQHFWDKQDPSTWTAQQITQFTSASPWAKPVTAVLTTNNSNMAATDEPRSGHSGRYSSRDTPSVPSTSSLPKLQAIVQWVSAKPMQQVLKLHLPATFQGRYVLCVNGLPLSGNISSVVDDTTLQIKRGEAVHPENAYQDPSDTSTIYFAFLPSMIDVPGGKTAAFSMTDEPYSVKVRFNLGEMKYHGEPAF